MVFICKHSFEVIWPKIMQILNTNHQLPESTLQSTSEVIPQTRSKLQNENVLPYKEKFEIQFYLSYQNYYQITWTFFNIVQYLKINHGNIFTMRLVKHWHNCPVSGDIQGERVWATSSTEDWSLQGLDYRTFNGLFQPKLFYDTMTFHNCNFFFVECPFFARSKTGNIWRL